MDLYLHVGLPKTGTSSLQLFFSNERAFLMRHSILYPGTGIQIKGHHAFARAFAEDVQAENLRWATAVDSSQLMGDFKREVSAKKPGIVLLSSEAFVPVKIVTPLLEALKSLELFQNVKIIVYLRRQDEYLESRYAQSIAVHDTAADPEEFYVHEKQKLLLDFLWLLDQYEKLAGKTNLIVIPFEPEQNQPDLITDFCKRVFSLDPAGKVKTGYRANERLNRHALEFVRRFRPSEPMATAKNSYFLSVLSDWSRGQSDDPEYRYLLPPDLRKQILNECSDMNRAIARKYMGRDDGVLFQNVTVNTNWKNYRMIPEEVLFDIVGYLYDNLYSKQEVVGESSLLKEGADSWSAKGSFVRYLMKLFKNRLSKK